VTGYDVESSELVESGVFVARGESVENEELVEGADCMGDFIACLKPSATPTKVSQRFVILNSLLTWKYRQTWAPWVAPHGVCQS